MILRIATQFSEDENWVEYSIYRKGSIHCENTLTRTIIKHASKQESYKHRNTKITHAKFTNVQESTYLPSHAHFTLVHKSHSSGEFMG